MNGVGDFLKFVVGVYFDDTETSGLIALENDVKLFHNVCFGPRIREIHGAILDVTRNGMENSKPIHIVKIDT